MYKLYSVQLHGSTTIHGLANSKILCDGSKVDSDIRTIGNDPINCPMCMEKAKIYQLGRPRIIEPYPVPSVYAQMDEDTGIIYLSAYASDDPMWENNHIELRDSRNSKHSSVLQILSNVLQQCSVSLKIEP